MHQLPNLLTLLRLALVLPIAGLLLSDRHGQALVLFAVAGGSDALDGFLARRFGWTSRFGSLFDPLADKLLLVTSFICLTITQVLPLWLTLVVFLRDLVILLGAGLFRVIAGPADFSPSRLGKLTTLLQMLLVVCLLLELSLAPVLASLRWPLSWLVLVVTLCSGTQYVWDWGRKYRYARMRA
ncbi:CDP-alcohol phosphatidyltransferase family protein [Metapseudomonas lalkuanensis]|uniref:CDP-diacylglycerol--glycerol-3-phosphate 3-phosphatidyltransferase n=1 Tax=Metapseudomonas lalkuanensis TaxID=2604832 RepID=A0A5J6QPW3_9GAMM|nr:CDP-alcohol phosphatidyltransferase family protein [Pseudomonas lalkuanensis]QEY64524.1 CDP-alcohol phosphatidyltransferase family protein [Pseudomonas lalkuanensis]UCO97074.1 CDP-alcohol phosphatidyltransferase family protein [Pseudomonas lalkuanensis]